MPENLFGVEQGIDTTGKTFIQLSRYGKMKRMWHYRIGTKDQCCKTCEHLLRGEYHNKNYHKCELIGVSHSLATDIRLKNVCDKYQDEAL